MRGSALDSHRRDRKVRGRDPAVPWARYAAMVTAAAAMLGLGGCSLLLDFDEPSSADAAVDAPPADATGDK